MCRQSSRDAEKATLIKTEPTVLLVDDSITVRELLSMTFNNAGYHVEQARDGQRSLEKLCDGLPATSSSVTSKCPEWTAWTIRMQKDPKLSHLPIAMLTSRVQTGTDKWQYKVPADTLPNLSGRSPARCRPTDAKGEVLVTTTSNARKGRSGGQGNEKYSSRVGCPPLLTVQNPQVHLCRIMPYPDKPLFTTTRQVDQVDEYNGVRYQTLTDGSKTRTQAKAG